MKLSARAFALVIVASNYISAAASKPVFDTSGKCLQENPRTFKSQKSCGERGTVSTPAGAKSYPAFSGQECASRCYATTPHCVSFAIVHPAKNSNTPGECTVYTKTARNAANCYKYTSIDDTPVKDGGFSAESSFPGDPWSESGSAFTHSDEGGNFIGTIHVAYSSDQGEPSGRIGQTVDTCQGETYQLTYENADGYNDSFGDFEIEVDGVVLRNVTKTVGAGLTEQAPLYFMAASSTATIEFYASQFSAEQSSASEFEVIDNVKLRAVYRGSLKPGTKVPTI